jgi:ABC-2 type transport system ATP-binding protein
MTQTTAAVAAVGLRVSRGGRRVLHGLDFEVARGRITGLLGPSGCGKTTLMRAIVGVQIVESGDVRVLGAPATRIGETLDIVQLADAADRPVRNLSGGQRARVSLATALLGEPDILVLDEPTVGLDPLLREDLWRTFGELADRGTTLFVSSHVMDEAARCDDLLLMREGRLLAALEPEELRERTGEDDMEQAFLRLIDEREGVPA